MEARLLDRTLSERVGDKLVEMSGPWWFISYGFPISYVVGRLLIRALLERVRGRALEYSPSAFRSSTILKVIIVRPVDVAQRSTGYY